MRFVKSSRFETSASELFALHSRDGLFERMIPPWEKVQLLAMDPGLAVGKRLELKIGTPIGSRRWLGEHVEYVEGKRFVDTQVKGPFASWRHKHIFESIDDRCCKLTDEIDYELPLGVAAGPLFGRSVARQLELGFDYRHRLLEADVSFRNRIEDSASLNILIVGGSGFLGTKLTCFLRSQGHSVAWLTRRRRRKEDIRWDPTVGEIERARLEGFDAVINLAGANLASGRWTMARKRLFRSSRIEATRFLVDALASLERPPKVFVCSSAVGYYGNDLEASRDESDKCGDGYLAELCVAWEAAALRAESLGCRVVLLRTGVALDPRGGALKRMLLPFRLGAGGPLGNGKQWFPWIALEDWIRAVAWTLLAKGLHGPVNLTAPGLVRQWELARTLGRVLNRPAFAPTPTWLLRLLFGEMADEVLLSSCRAAPKRLIDSGFRFQFEELESALRFSLGKLLEPSPWLTKLPEKLK